MHIAGIDKPIISDFYPREPGPLPKSIEAVPNLSKGGRKGGRKVGSCPRRIPPSWNGIVHPALSLPDPILLKGKERVTCKEAHQDVSNVLEPSPVIGHRTSRTCEPHNMYTVHYEQTFPRRPLPIFWIKFKVTDYRATNADVASLSLPDARDHLDR